MLNPFVESAKRLKLTPEQIKRLVPKFISAAEYKELTGEEYSA